MLNILPSVVVLGLAAFAALLLVRRRPSPPRYDAARLAAARALTVAVVLQSVHFAEEAATGFHFRLGNLLGLPPIPVSGFILFNVTWIAIWIASVPGLRSNRSAAFFAAWFLAIAGMVNGIAHPLLAVADGGYFPGLATSPFTGAASIWLWFRLRAATETA